MAFISTIVFNVIEASEDWVLDSMTALSKNVDC